VSSLPRFQDKIDVLDMIISILKDHEENLSNIIDKLDTFVENFSSLEKKIATIGQSLQNAKFTYRKERRVFFVECRNWSEFREMSIGASLVAFEIAKNVLSVSSASSEFIFKYSEKLPTVDSLTALQPGDSSHSEALNPNPLGIRAWLSEELKIPEHKILEGKFFAT